MAKKPIILTTKFASADLDKNAVWTVLQLLKKGFEAYLVGGCVRDLLLDKKPKDFDIVTSATPEQVKAVFKRARIIGRRFRLVHVLFGRRDFLEVSTFRSGAITTSEKNSKLGNKVYGTIEQDALRRDFTINALYYDVKKHCVLDYASGLEDIKNKKLVMIGDEVTRYQEDPVRLLRAVRFMVKFDLVLDKTQIKNIAKFGHLLIDIPPARLFEEALKLFHNLDAFAVFEALNKHKLLPYLLPKTKFSALVILALKNTQKRLKNNQSISVAFLFAVFLWDEFSLAKEGVEKTAKNRQRLLFYCARTVILAQIKHTSFAKYISEQIIDIWLLQEKLGSVNKKNSKKILANFKFRAGYDLLILRANSGEKKLQKAVDFWTQQQDEQPR